VVSAQPGLNFDSKNKLLRSLEVTLRQKTLVEANAALVIRQLQESNCFCFAVTARDPSLAAVTRQTLLSLGIDFAVSAPFPPVPLVDPLTSALYADGVLYVGLQPKAAVVSRFLENIVFANLLREYEAAPSDLCTESETDPTTHSAEYSAQLLPPSITPLLTPRPQTKERKPPSALTSTLSKSLKRKFRPPKISARRMKLRQALPPKIVFVDNEIAHVKDFANNGVEIAKRLDIPMDCYLFVPPAEQATPFAQKNPVSRFSRQNPRKRKFEFNSIEDEQAIIDKLPEKKEPKSRRVDEESESDERHSTFESDTDDQNKENMSFILNRAISDSNQSETEYSIETQIQKLKDQQNLHPKILKVLEQQNEIEESEISKLRLPVDIRRNRVLILYQQCLHFIETKQILTNSGAFSQIVKDIN